MCVCVCEVGERNTGRHLRTRAVCVWVGEGKVYLRISPKSVTLQVECDATQNLIPIDHVPQDTEDDVQQCYHSHAGIDHTLGVLWLLHLIL